MGIIPFLFSFSAYYLDFLQNMHNNFFSNPQKIVVYYLFYTEKM